MAMASMLKSVLKNLFGKPATRLYPFVRREAFADTRGLLDIDISKCIFCGLCAKRCPANALAVTKKPQPSWTVDAYRCILCGYCLEACPKKCLVMRSYDAKVGGQ